MALLYNFKKGKTNQYLLSIGRVPRDVSSTFQNITINDFDTLVQEDKAIITEDGAYFLDSIGNRQPVYFYKKSYSFYWQGERKEPKFHICRCEIIRDFGENSYSASNQTIANVHNKSHRYGHGEFCYEVEMDLCTYCAKIVTNPPETTLEFYQKAFEIFKEQNENLKATKTDLYGYTIEWTKISRAYRKSANYVCKKCRTDLSDNTRWLHVHHIDGNKINNHPSNLESLCIECHSEVNEHHENKFRKGRNNRDLQRFRERYRT